MTNSKLSSIQQKLLDLLISTEETFTIRQMQYRLDLSSTSIVVRHLNHLEKKGYIKRNPHNPRDYLILTKGPEKTIAWLNLYGLVQCGKNGELLDNNPIERLPVATRLLTFSSAEAFLVKAKGDSMSPRIMDGDLIIVRQNNDAANGKIVVCVNNGEALIKKIQRDNKSTILFSFNPLYNPFLASEDFRIIGEVKGIISSAY